MTDAAELEAGAANLRVGTTLLLENDAVRVHDLENVGETTISFTTVELLGR